MCLLLLLSSLPRPTPNSSPPPTVPAQHPTFASPLSVSKNTQADLPHVTMHRRVHRCSPPLLSSVFQGPGRDPHVVAVPIPCEADSDRQRDAWEAAALRMRARPAGIGPAKGDERAWPHHISRCKQGKRARPAALSLAIGGTVALVINGVRGGNMQR